MKSHTHYLWFNTKQRQEIIDITDTVVGEVEKSGVREGLVLVSAMHISASVFVNDHESGCGTTFSDGSRDRALGSQALPAQRNRGGQRRRPPPQPDGGARSDRTDYCRQADFGPWQRVFYGNGTVSARSG